MVWITRTDGRKGLLAAHGAARGMAEDPATGEVVAEVDALLLGDVEITVTEYDGAKARIVEALPAPDPDPRDTDQEAIDAFAAGDDAKQTDAVRAMAKRLAST